MALAFLWPQHSVGQVSVSSYPRFPILRAVWAWQVVDPDASLLWLFFLQLPLGFIPVPRVSSHGLFWKIFLSAPGWPSPASRPMALALYHGQ